MPSGAACHARSALVEGFPRRRREVVGDLGLHSARSDDADADALADQLLRMPSLKASTPNSVSDYTAVFGRATLPAVELTVTTSATPRGESAAAVIRWGSEARVAYRTPSMLTATRSSQSFNGASRRRPCAWSGVVHQMSGRPSSPMTAARRWRPGPRRSHPQAPPAPCRPPLRSSPPVRAVGRHGGQQGDRRVLPGHARAVAAPVPLLAPVTNATVPASVAVTSSPSWACR